MNVDWLKCTKCCLKSELANKSTTEEKIVIKFTLLELAPKLGQRVHFAEGTNLRCREDPPITSDSEERSAEL
ncbi:unnamed protein product [Lasius platythorax]|uniref:Uncharacterized protein n=1 Tax=Lasius platythorax TaxID=488582 RepID=A0AAV2P584_9HYME